MEVKNLSWDSMTARSNHKLLPKNVRGLIIGKSDCGKTTLLLNLLLNPGWLDYNKLFVFSKSLFQPEYQVLRKANWRIYGGFRGFNPPPPWAAK